MDLIKAKTILGRLQAMHLALESNSHLSALERDLILNYLRELYHIYLDADVPAMPTVKATTIPASPEPVIEKEPIQKTLEFKFGPVEEPMKAVERKPVVTETGVIHAVVPIPPRETPEHTVEITKANGPATPFILAPIQKNSHIRSSIQELFNVKKGTELSDKLHELPLKDINRAIGINDRLEYTAVLFGGQKSLFEQTINELNNFKSFDEAVDLLGPGPALNFKWDYDDQKEKAIEFIKLIRRRYL